MSDPTRVVADADVLAADLLVGGPARQALDLVRSHEWLELFASEALLSDLEAVVADLASADLARDHREMLQDTLQVIEHPERDHPGLASAHVAGAAHLLSYDQRLGSAKAGLTLQPRMSVSVRPPEAFVAVFDPEPLYEERFDRPYPGPDRDPRR